MPKRVLFLRSSIASWHYKDPVVHHGASSCLDILCRSHHNVALFESDVFLKCSVHQHFDFEETFSYF
jgi:hypothetical protein